MVTAVQPYPAVEKHLSLEVNEHRSQADTETDRCDKVGREYVVFVLRWREDVTALTRLLERVKN